MSEGRTWLATVLFLDIVSYSTEDVNQQLKTKLHFQNLVSQEIDKLEEQDTIRLDTGDGMAICYFGDPEIMYPVARRLRDDFSSLQNGSEYSYKVRLGLNLGPVKIVEDLNHERNCIGSGINDAERIMSFASGNQLLVSKSYFEIVSKISNNYSTELNYLGLRSDKHDKQHDVYELVVDVVKASDFPTAFESGSRLKADVTSDAEKFDPQIIERITNEFVKYIKRTDAEEIIRQSIRQTNNINELCALLLQAISDVDDRYSFDQYLKYYGYTGYS